MGIHTEWRKLAKKARRKRIRTKLAKIRDDFLNEEEERLKRSPSYVAKEAEESARLAELEEEERKTREELQKKWEEEERRVREQTQLLHARAKQMEEEKLRKEEEQAELIKRKEEAEKKKQELIADYIYKFAMGQHCSLPAEMLIPSETHPGKEACPFFNKVAACRFWDSCSRNHIRPALSNILLFPGFYSHYSISQIWQGEYDTDNSLEYDDKETYSHFLEFYRDIRYEFESCGRLTRLIVCLNPELHLRGNVYVSYASEREAMSAYLKFNRRFYAGKQLSCEFATIPSWKSAICGLFFRKKCPKGNACNFLHVFKDPGPPFFEPESSGRSPDIWRWSESPESDRMNNSSCTGSANKKKSGKRRERSGPTENVSSTFSKNISNSKDMNRSRSEKQRTNTSERKRHTFFGERRRSQDRIRRSRSPERRKNSSPETRKMSLESSESRSSERLGSKSSEMRIGTPLKRRRRSKSPGKKTIMPLKNRRSRSSEKRRSRSSEKRRSISSERR